MVLWLLGLLSMAGSLVIENSMAGGVESGVCSWIRCIAAAACNVETRWWYIHSDVGEVLNVDLE